MMSGDEGGARVKRFARVLGCMLVAGVVPLVAPGIASAQAEPATRAAYSARAIQRRSRCATGSMPKRVSAQSPRSAGAG